jgi:hypothetical protein
MPESTEKTRAWEAFTGRWFQPDRGKRPRKLKPFVRIYNGQIFFSRSAIESLKNPDAVVFYIDRETRAIGIRAALLTDRHAYPIATRKEKAARRSVTAYAFCSHYDIPRSIKGRLSAHLENDMLIIPLPVSEKNVIDDGLGNTWSAICSQCGRPCP